MADGFTLIVPKTMLDRLEVADQKITQLATKSEDASKRVVLAFNEMATKGVDKFIDSLNRAQIELNKLSQTKVNFDSMFNTTKSVSEITKLIEALAKLSSVQNKKTGETTKQDTSDVQKINALYRERMNLTKQLSSLMQKGEKLASKGGLRAEESAQISTIRALIQAKENEIEQYRKSETLGTKAKQALMKGEMEYTLMVNEETRKLQAIKDKARQDELNKEKKKQQEIAALDSKNRKNNYNNYVTTYEGALRTSGKAKNLLQEEQAIKNLEAAKAKLNKTDADYANKLETLNQAINKHKQNIKDANLTNEQREKIAKRNTEAAEREAKALERKNKIEREKKIASSADSAINYSRSKEVKSINDQIKAIQLLKQARGQLQNTGSAGKYEQDIRRLTIEINRQQASVDALIKKQQALGQSHNSLMNTGDQLARKLAMIFSVSAIQGYIQKLANVRAEFELNQRALGAILQDKDKADKLWGQTVNLALKSPFRVKELVGYTKQLAAYRIESDKLFDTNKRLADVSAGLGVDMQRLILAYGQVRAAEYLRGTELRQFTEAGIPMLDELARYFTEIEGHAVSTADVFQRISKRMVNFSDVEEVFNRLTSAGGVFYEMQEKQSDTLYGQISNLHDALDLMMNDIGMANEGLLKGSVEIARSLVDNWEEVWDRLQFVIYGFALVKTSSFLMARGIKAATTATSMFGVSIKTSTAANWKFWASMKQGELVAAGWSKWSAKWIIGINKVKIAMLGLSSALKTFAPMLLITGIMEAIMYFTEASRAAERLQKDLQNIQDSIGKEKDESLDNYKKLAEKINNVTTSYNERKDALEELKRTYKDILPDYMLEINYLEQLSGEYGNVQIAMEAFYDAKSKREQRTKIDEEKGEDIKEQENKLAKLFDFERANKMLAIKQKRAEAKPNDDIAQFDVERMQKYILSVDLKDALISHWSTSISEVVEDVKNGKVAAEYNAMMQAIIQNFEKWYGRALTENEKTSIFSLFSEYNGLTVADNAAIKNAAKDLASSLKPYEDVINSTSKTKGKSWGEEKYGKAIRQEATELERLRKIYEDLDKSLTAYYNLKKKEGKKGLSVNESREVEQLEKDIKTGYQQLGQEAPDFKGITKDIISLKDESKGIWQTVLSDMAYKLNPQLEQTKMNIASMPSTIAESKKGMDNAFGDVSLLPKPEDIKNTSDSLGTFFDTYGKIPKSPFVSSLETMPTVIDQSTVAMGQFTEELNAQSKALDSKPLETFTQDVTREVANATGLSSDLFDAIAMKSGETLEQFHNKAVAQMNVALERYNETKRLIEQNPTRVNFILNMQGFDSMADLKQEKQKADAIKDILIKTGWTDKSKQSRKKSGKSKDPTSERIKLLEELYSQFEKLNNLRPDNKAAEIIEQDYSDAFKSILGKVKGFGEGISSVDFTNIDGLVESLETLLASTKKGTKGYKELQKVIAKYKTERDDKKLEEEQKKREENVKKLWEEYDAYKSLKELGVSGEVATALFGVNTKSLDDLRQKVEGYYGDISKLGEEQKKEYEKLQAEITEKEQKEQEERLKTYLQYARDAVGERAKIKLEEIKKIAEIEEATVVKEDEQGTQAETLKLNLRKTATEKAMKEYQQKVQKFEWKEFQKSDIFLMIFEDLENANANLVRSTLSKIKEYKEAWTDMPLDEVKVMTDKIMQLEAALLKLESPFKALKITKGEIESILGHQTREQVYEESLQASERISINEKDIDKLSAMRSLWQQNGHITQEIAMTLADMGIKTSGNIAVLDDEIAKRKKVNQNLQQAVDRAKALAKADKKSVEYSKAQADAYNNLNSEAQKLFDCTRDLMETFGDKDGMASIFVDMSSSIVDTVFSTLALQANIKAVKLALDAAGVSASSFGYILNTAMGVIGWIVMAVQLITQAFSAAFKAHDKAKQKEIDEEVKSIERLEKELENLEEGLEAVYSLGGVNKSMRQVQANIDKQIQSYENMMRLEEEKKSTDEDQIEEWKDNIEELREKREELHKEMVESLGGNYDVRSVAREFVDAWIDAFKETGDGLKGLRDNFKDFFLNILLEQAVMQKVGGLFSDAMDYLNNDVLSDYIVTDAERKKTEGMFDEAMIKTDDYFNLLFGENGVLNKYIDDTDSSLSGLQQGIQGVTEETAQIIEAYLNSIRFYIAQDNQNLAKLVDTFTNVESPNPILSELRTQTELITSIRDLFRDVVRMGHPTYGGAFLKVAL